MVIATSLTQSWFYRRAIIDRESAVVQDMVTAVTREQENENMLSSRDILSYTESISQFHLRHSFGGLRQIPGVVLLKVFNTDQTIVWSDDPKLIGTNTSLNRQDLSQAIAGQVRAVRFSTEFIPNVGKPTLVEFYVPFTLRDHDGKSPMASGVLSIYQSRQDINEAIFQGTLLLWLVTGVGGLILYAALYRLFRAVYFSHQKIELELMNISDEHKQLMQVGKLAAMGQMMSEIAHQLNNPLVGVVNLAQLAEREIDNPEQVKSLLVKVREAGEQCRDFVQRMLRITKIARSEPHITNLNVLVHETIAFLQQSLGGRTAISFHESVDPIMIDVDPTLIRNALFNLIHNAAQADETGPITVSLQIVKRSGQLGCELAVADHGPGITPDVAEKIFTPFFTTRAGGIGLGLSIANHIAVLHGGSIRAENNVDGGARFIMWLPIKGQGHDGQNIAG